MNNYRSRHAQKCWADGRPKLRGGFYFKRAVDGGFATAGDAPGASYEFGPPRGPEPEVAMAGWRLINGGAS